MRTEQGVLLAGRYRLTQLIAIGGMGEVWEATDTVLGRDVAVKVMREEFRATSTFLERFRAEARHAGGLSHPGIASVFDYGEEPDAAFLVMELVRGRPLSESLASGPALSTASKVAILRQTADALQAAHDAGVIHRDVKPGNLLVRPDGTVKVTDFGIARALSSAPLTDNGQLIGTPTYMSPEQASGGSVTASSDVYSLGVVAYELFAGRPPFVRDTPVALAFSHVHDMPPPMPDHVPRGVSELIASALAKDPLRRPRSAGEFSSLLQSVMLARGGDPTLADDATLTVATVGPAAHTMVGSALAAAPVAAVAGPLRRTDDQGARRRPPVTALLFVGLLTAIVVGIWAVATGGEGDAERSPTSSTLAADSSVSQTTVAATDTPSSAVPTTMAPTTMAPTTLTPTTVPATVAATAPPTVAPTTPPPSSVAAAPPVATASPGDNPVTEGEAVAFVTDYYEALAAGDYETTWPLLSEEFRDDRDLTFDGYVAYWERYSIELSNLRFFNSSASGDGRVRFDARYATGTTTVDETDELTLRRTMDGSLIIVAQRRV